MGSAFSGADAHRRSNPATDLGVGDGSSVKALAANAWLPDLGTLTPNGQGPSSCSQPLLLPPVVLDELTPAVRHQERPIQQ